MEYTTKPVKTIYEPISKHEADVQTFQMKIAAEGAKIDNWANQQLLLIKKDHSKFSKRTTEVSDEMAQQREDAIINVQQEASRQWNALNAAMAAYRSYLADEFDLTDAKITSANTAKIDR